MHHFCNACHQDRIGGKVCFGRIMFRMCTGCRSVKVTRKCTC